jgi:hypothetical protein
MTQIRLAQRRSWGTSPAEVRRRFDALIAGFADAEELLGWLRAHNVKGLAYVKNGFVACASNALFAVVAKGLCPPGFRCRVERDGWLCVIAPWPHGEVASQLPEPALSVQRAHSAGLLDDQFYGWPPSR